MSVCCRRCRFEAATEGGLKVHLARAHGIIGAQAAQERRRADERREPCPYCPRAFQPGKGLSIHLYAAHGIASDHPKRQANQGVRGAFAASDGAHLLPRLPDGPIAMLETVIALARYDTDRKDAEAAAWLRDLQSSLINTPKQ